MAGPLPPGANGPVTLPTLLAMLEQIEERVMGSIRGLRDDMRQWAEAEAAHRAIAEQASRQRHAAINERFATMAVVEAERKGRWWAVHLTGSFLGRYGGTLVRLLVAAAIAALAVSGGLTVHVGA